MQGHIRNDECKKTDEVINTTVIEIQGLTKRYKKQTVVDHVNLVIQKGHIYGLIGPNGAGKTTIMKTIAGLVLPNEGDISLFGSKDNNKSRERMSFMIEAPYLDGSMNAVKNLKYASRIRGIQGDRRIQEVLEFVGLADAGKKKVSHFSLGMKQRLGIAIALLSEPEVMVLDEPINGLDPEGIVEVRNMIQYLSHTLGMTVLISSHILSELAELCTDYAIINHGKLVDQFSAEQLTDRCSNYLSIETDDIEKTREVLLSKLGIKNMKVEEGKELRVYEKLEELPAISKTITQNQLCITQFVLRGSTLEEYYLQKVGEAHA